MNRLPRVGLFALAAATCGCGLLAHSAEKPNFIFINIDDLGLDVIGPGCRPLDRVADAHPIIGFDGKVRAGLGAD